MNYENEIIGKTIHTIHTIKHNMYPGKSNTGENPAGR
jgi:hypothetical protein